MSAAATAATAPAGGDQPPAAKRLAADLHELFYFNLEGKGEPIRLAFALGGVPFVDHRVTGQEWQALKPTMKFGQMPMLRTPDNEELVQSASIIRYVGRLAEGDTLYPASNLALASHIDSIIDNEGDLFTAILVFKYPHRYGFTKLSEETRAKVAADMINETLPQRLGQFEKLLEGSPTPWLGGTPEPSIADCVLAPRLKDMEEGGAMGDAHRAALAGIVSKHCPRVAKFLKDFYAHPAVAKYYAARKQQAQEQAAAAAAAATAGAK